MVWIKHFLEETLRFSCTFVVIWRYAVQPHYATRIHYHSCTWHFDTCMITAHQRRLEQENSSSNLFYLSCEKKKMNSAVTNSFLLPHLFESGVHRHLRLGEPDESITFFLFLRGQNLSLLLCLTNSSAKVCVLEKAFKNQPEARDEKRSHKRRELNFKRLSRIFVMGCCIDIKHFYFSRWHAHRGLASLPTLAHKKPTKNIQVKFEPENFFISLRDTKSAQTSGRSQIHCQKWSSGNKIHVRIARRLRKYKLILFRCTFVPPVTPDHFVFQKWKWPGRARVKSRDMHDLDCTNYGWTNLTMHFYTCRHHARVSFQTFKSTARSLVVNFAVAWARKRKTKWKCQSVVHSLTPNIN